MSDIAMDIQTGDILITNSRLSLIQDPIEVMRQKLKIRLQTFREEWFLNLGVGLPYFQEFFVKGTPKDLVDITLRDYILDTEGVVEITSFESTFNDATRKYSLSFGVTIPNGQELNIIGFEV